MLKMLFICTHNRCRSILAEAIGRKLSKGQIDVRSAGSQPAGEVHPQTLIHLKLRNVSVDDLTSKSWHDLSSFKPDVVITVCDQAANESCPVWMGDALKIHWGLPDPSKLEDPEELKMAFFKVIDVLQKRMSFILDQDLKDMDMATLENYLLLAQELN